MYQRNVQIYTVRTRHWTNKRICRPGGDIKYGRPYLFKGTAH